MDCKEWLEKQLSGCDAVLCDTIRACAKEQGFTKKQLKEARAILGVKTYHQLNDDADTNWFWYL